MLDAFTLVIVRFIMDRDLLDMKWKERPMIPPYLLYPSSCPSFMMAIPYFPVLIPKP